MKPVAHALFVTALFTGPAAALAQDTPESANAVDAPSGVRGVNPAELNNRADAILKVINLPQGESISFVGKYDMKLGNSFGLNFELPLVTYVNIPVSNVAGINATGTGDLFTRLRYVAPVSRKVFVLGSAELVLPVASETATGAGKWQFNVAAGGVYIWNLKSFSAAIYKKTSSIAGSAARDDISSHQFRALHTFVLDRGWYVTGDGRYELSTIGRNEDWVQAEFEVGRQINARWAASLRVGKVFGDRANDGTLELNIRTFL